MATSEDEVVDDIGDPREHLQRIVALSDGVFAVAITLLVLDIRIGDRVPREQLWEAILGLAKGLQSYFISFVVIGMYWGVHRKIFSVVRRYDGGLIWLNLLFLFSISFLPVPTSVLSDYASTSVAVAFYAACMTVTGLLSFVLWWYVARDYRLIDSRLPYKHVVTGFMRALIPPVVFALSIGVAFIQIFRPAVTGADLAQFFWLSIAAGEVLIVRIRRGASE